MNRMPMTMRLHAVSMPLLAARVRVLVARIVERRPSHLRTDA